MENTTLQHYIREWLQKYHAPEEHQAVLKKAVTPGKSKQWTDAIQNYVREETLHNPTRIEIKRACSDLRKQGG